MKKKLLAVGIIGILMATTVVGCSETEEAKYTSDLMDNAYDAVRFPDVSNYFERQQLKEIYELRDDPSLICYWYTKNEMTGKWIYQGTCIGYGIPYTTSMTAPESYQRIETPAGVYREVLPLAEPNGLYASPSTSATWILTADKDGNITPTQVESEITVSQSKLDVRLCEDWSLPQDYSTSSSVEKDETDTSASQETENTKEE